MISYWIAFSWISCLIISVSIRSPSVHRKFHFTSFHSRAKEESLNGSDSKIIHISEKSNLWAKIWIECLFFRLLQCLAWIWLLAMYQRFDKVFCFPDAMWEYRIESPFGQLSISIAFTHTHTHKYPNKCFTAILNP